MIVAFLILSVIVIFPLLRLKKRTSPKQIKDLLIKEILEEISEGDNFNKGNLKINLLRN
jgi:hypothetical protein